MRDTSAINRLIARHHAETTDPDRIVAAAEHSRSSAEFAAADAAGQIDYRTATPEQYAAKLRSLGVPLSRRTRSN